MSIQLQNAAHILQAIRTSWDAVVAPSGGDFTSIQDADDALDGGPYTLLVRPGTYAGWTTSTPNARIVLAPRVVLTSAVLLSGNDQKLLIGPGGDHQGLLTMGGAGVQVRAMNGWSNVGVLLSGNLGLLDGGGWGSLCDGGITRGGIDLSGDDCRVRNISAQTTAAGGAAFNGVISSGLRPSIKTVRVASADNNAISLGVGTDDGEVVGCFVVDSDLIGIRLAAPRLRCVANVVFNAGTNGIQSFGGFDDGAVNHNIVRAVGGNSIDLALGSDQNLVTGNRLVNAAVDGGAGNSLANNEVGAFT